MTKSGQCNIRHDAKEKTKRFLQDFFTTMVDMEWNYSFGIFLAFYAITWIIFSSLYFGYVISCEIEKNLKTLVIFLQQLLNPSESADWH